MFTAQLLNLNLTLDEFYIYLFLSGFIPVSLIAIFFVYIKRKEGTIYTITSGFAVAWGILMISVISWPVSSNNLAALLEQGSLTECDKTYLSDQLKYKDKLINRDFLLSRSFCVSGKNNAVEEKTLKDILNASQLATAKAFNNDFAYLLVAQSTVETPDNQYSGILSNVAPNVEPRKLNEKGEPIITQKEANDMKLFSEEFERDMKRTMELLDRHHNSIKK